MIIVRMIGGLGNQMFQYAFYKKLKENFPNVKCEIQGYENYNLHTGFGLQKYFDVKLDLATISEVNSLTSIYNKNFFSKVGRKLFGNKKSHITEANFNQAVLKEDNIYLGGYWQSDNYFGNKADLRKDFNFSNLDEQKDQEIHLIKSSNSVSLHVRRCDYVGNSIYAEQGKEYYINAMKEIADKIVSPIFFVFSDNIKWAEDELLADYKSKFSIVFCNDKAGSEIKDLNKMTLCKHNIIANSSFSWWGAWLNQNENKIVIYPKKWYTDETQNSKHINKMPENWKNI